MPALQFLQWLLLIVVLVYIYYFSVLFNRDPLQDIDYTGLETKIVDLENLLSKSNEHVIKLRKEIAQETALYREIISRLENGWKPEENLVDIGKIDGEIKWTSPIPVLVFVCNRAQALKQHVDKLLKYRPSSDLYPIIISQDCDSNEVTEVVRSYGSAVHYIKHLSGEKANIEVGPDHQRYITYYMIARHYKLGLDYVFNNKSYTSVIITEDDLDIAPDFFNYFSSTRELLDKDPTLFCVSAWNDNGKSNLINMDAGDLLYRSDFFPGLGWMMTRKLWDELGPIWPNGFWDDWIRDPLRRKNRACIRPEISRTAMTVEGRKGASKGLFFAKHLGKITLNVRPIDFTKINLDYLIKDKYDEAFFKPCVFNTTYNIARTSTTDFGIK